MPETDGMQVVLRTPESLQHEVMCDGTPEAHDRLGGTVWRDE